MEERTTTWYAFGAGIHTISAASHFAEGNGAWRYEKTLRVSHISTPLTGTTNDCSKGVTHLELDFAASAVRQVAHKFLSGSQAVDVVISKQALSKLSEIDRYSLAAIAEHPNSSVPALP